MTSKAPPRGNNNLVDRGDPYYTNEDVALLHEIVSHAEQLLPTLPPRERVPTNALFTAYYAILPNIGIDPDHDRRYARVLFKIGGMQGNGRLYEKFETVLGRMGIEIQFDGEAEGNDEDADNPHDSYRNRQAEIPTTSQILAPVSKERGERGRRNSESTIWNLAPEPERLARRPRSQSSMSRPDAGHFDAPFLHEFENHGNDGVLRQPLDKQGLRKAERDIGAWLSTTVEPPDSLHQQQLVSRAKSTYLSTDIECGSTGFTTEASSFSDPDLAQQKDHAGPIFSIPRTHENAHLHPSNTILDIKALLIHDHRLGKHVRWAFGEWRQKSTSSQKYNSDLLQTAEVRDRHLLLRQAFETWKAIVQERQRHAETEAFFAQLGSRASMARDLFLLTKAFTHWAQTTSDEIERTSLARRHILRTRFFKAWRDITAVNELKVRRQVLKRFFAQWQRRHHAISQDFEQSLRKYEGELVQKKYWLWFWAFCERRAPLWRETRDKRNAITYWISRARANIANAEIAQAHHMYMTKARPLKTWATRSNNVTSSACTAESHHAKALLIKSLVYWNSESALLLPRFQVQNMVVARLKRQSLLAMKLRAGQERMATALDRQKALREAFSTWNDELRCLIIQARIGERLQSQALYKWVIAERLALSMELKNRKMQRIAIDLLRHRTGVNTEKNMLANRQAQAIMERNLKHHALCSLRSTLQHVEELKFQACQSLASTSLTRSLYCWSTQKHRIAGLESRSHLLEFYFLTNKTIGKWKAAVEQSRKQKQREIYRSLRKENRMRLARQILTTWRDKTKAALDFVEQAEVFYMNRTIVIGIDAFDRWRARADDIAELEIIQRRQALKKHLTVMLRKSVALANLTSEAISFDEDRIADQCLKQWTRVALQLRAREYVVKEIRDKSRKRVSRRILIYWRQRTPYSKQSTDDGSATLRDQSKTGATARASSWSESGDDVETDEWVHEFDSQVTKVSLPGYLTTPSRRAQRIRATSSHSSTTPMGPLSTPFEKRLRDQYFGGSLAVFKRAQGESMARGFQDIGKSV